MDPAMPGRTRSSLVTRPMPSRVHLRSLLVLGRVSNLPTVWSNCLAAWLLNGGDLTAHFILLSVAATLLYTGGMFLNDAFDAEFDRRHRSERPIPAGKISVRTVWLFGSSLLVTGWLLILPLGSRTALVALLLGVTILAYDAIHKRTTLAPLLMAACRLLLYFVAASATQRSVNDAVLWHALALAAYVTGLSYFARGETGQGRVRRWPILPLIAPLVASGLVNPHRGGLAWAAWLCLAGWLLWCLRGILNRPLQSVGRTVAGLLAGIALVDAATLSQLTAAGALIFGGLFVLALILQRQVPAT